MPCEYKSSYLLPNNAQLVILHYVTVSNKPIPAELGVGDVFFPPQVEEAVPQNVCARPNMYIYKMLVFFSSSKLCLCQAILRHLHKRQFITADAAEHC